MKRYHIDIINRKTITIPAEDRKEALLVAKDAYPEHIAEHIEVDDESEPNSCINYCEDCKKAIFDDDKSATDADYGITLCADCTPPIEDMEFECQECNETFGYNEVDMCGVCGDRYCLECYSAHNCAEEN